MGLLSVREAAERLGVKPATVYSWIERENPILPFVRFSSRAVRFRPEDIEAFIARSTVRPS